MAELKEESSEATCEGASKEFCSETPLEDKTNLLQTTPTRDSGWYSTFEDARKAIEEDELSTFTRYASWVTKSFKGDSSIKKEDFNYEKHKPRFEDIKSKDGQQQIKFDGVPFVIIGHKIYTCQHGPDKNITTKRKREKLLEDKENVDHAGFTKRRFLAQNSKKFDCPAKLQVREVIRFSAYKNTEWLKRKVSESLRAAWRNDTFDDTSIEKRYYVKFPDVKEHQNHKIGEGSGICQKVDGRIVEKIQILVGEGVRSVREMERHIKLYVKNELFRGLEKPSQFNRRYNPTRRDITNHMYQATVRLRFSKIDQNNLACKIEEWKKEYPQDKFFFRGYGEIVDEEPPDNSEDEIKVKQTGSTQKLLFVHQTAFHRQLLKRYGNHICLLDATYRTTKYSIPLFFVVVKTNVDYQVVGSFAIQDETTHSIGEALEVLSSWNDTWRPKFFMTDNCEEEIQAIESQFEECKVLLCDFHREQAWERWLTASANGMRPYKDITLVYLRKIAKSETEESYEKAKEELLESELWNAEQSKKLRDWFGKTWLPQYKRWVWAFRKSTLEIVVRTNNGVERQNRDFKHEYLKNFKDNSLSGMVTVLIEHFLPDKCKMYVERNTRCSSSYRKYNESIPPFLHNRPRQFVDHCKDRLVSSESIQETSINRDADVYIISSHGRKYRLSFDDPETMPFCECKDWDRFQLPCKHFMAVIQSNHEASWESFPVFYRESPFFTLDESILFSSQATLQDHALELGHPEEDISVEGNVVFKDVPRRVHVPRSKAASCRELLSEIKSLSYIIYDEDVLETLHSELLSALDELREAAPQDNGLLLSHPFRVTRKPEEMFTNNQKRFKRIPVAKSRKGKFTGRVGIGAEEKRKATSYKITAVKKEQKLETIMEEPVPFEENWEEMYDLNNLPAPNPYARGWDDDVSFESTGVEAGSTQCAPSQISSDESSSSGDDVNANDDNDDEDVTITKVRTREPPTERPKHRKLKLSPTETNSILNNRMLTDESINIAQNNLHKQFPEFAGFEDTVLSATQMFSVFKSFRKYIQILHTGDLHWVCTANLDDHRGRNDSASLYDSLNGGKVPHRVATQIAAFSFCQDAELKITVEPVQQQSNGVDCGVYAIAFATSLAFGEDPCKITYDEPKMRAHLLHCLKSRKMIPFPKVQSRITCLRSENRVAYVELFCSCRLPYDIEDDEDNPNKDMAECSECLSWFHRSCEQIPDWVFYKSKARRKWYCKLCDKSQSE